MSRSSSRARGPGSVLGLVTEAYGGIGGIAQYNRDFYDALSAVPGIGETHLLPRRGTPQASPRPARLRLHAARSGRVSYAAAALHLALHLEPDVVICGHLFMISAAATAARLCGAKLVVQVHGIEIWRELGAVRRRALESAALVLCVSRDTRARVLAAAAIAPERVLVLPNTVAGSFRPQPTGVPRAPGRPRVLLSVSRLDARETYKGHDAVIGCLPQLLRQGHDVVYEIAGQGDDRARLEDLAQAQGVADRVRFLGLVAPDALPDLYRAADLFVLASRGEGFGIVFLEAMACGTPALGLACGGAVDALDGLGRAVAPDALAPAIAEELDRSAHGRSDADANALADRVRGRFGAPQFEAGVSRVVARLGLVPSAGAEPVALRDAASAGAPA